MDVDDYKKKYGELQHLEDYLNYAAFILHQDGLEHRTLNHFNFFISSLVFGRVHYENFKKAYPNGNPNPEDNMKSFAFQIEYGRAKDGLDIYNKYNSLYDNEGDPWIKYAKAFVRYCEEEYGDDYGT